MSKEFRYECLGGPFEQWIEADKYIQGYRKALCDNGLKSEDIKYVLCMHGSVYELRDGDVEKESYAKSGFYCVKKVKLNSK